MHNEEFDSYRSSTYINRSIDRGHSAVAPGKGQAKPSFRLECFPLEHTASDDNGWKADGKEAIAKRSELPQQTMVTHLRRLIQSNGVAKGVEQKTTSTRWLIWVVRNIDGNQERIVLSERLQQGFEKSRVTQSPESYTVFSILRPPKTKSISSETPLPPSPPCACGELASVRVSSASIMPLPGSLVYGIQVCVVRFCRSFQPIEVLRTLMRAPQSLHNRSVSRAVHTGYGSIGRGDVTLSFCLLSC